MLALRFRLAQFSFFFCVILVFEICKFIFLCFCWDVEFVVVKQWRTRSSRAAEDLPAVESIRSCTMIDYVRYFC